MIKIVLMILLSVQIWAGFNFGECSGSGTFKQEIEAYGGDYENTVTVGEIPTGIKGLYIELISDKDVDIRLYGENDDKIVHWPYGLLNGALEATTTYKNTSFTYSGYNGFDKQRGHEFIKVDGTTPTTLSMKAFGYLAGYATVNYSWTGKEGCSVQKEGASSFQQEIPSKGVALVGVIPTGIENLKVDLTSASDLDIQLFGADGTAIVSWSPKGLLSGSSKQTIDYHGMTIEWSGYNGVDGEKGNEYIKISNTTTEALTMKVYGYQAGFADVTYSWGLPKENLAHKYGIARQGTTNVDYIYYKPARNVIDNNDSTYNHTQNNLVDNWVEVALPALAKLSKVTVKIGLTQFAYRLKDAKVYLSQTTYMTEDTLDQANLIGRLNDTPKEQVFNLPGDSKGQYIIVKAANGNFLHIAEIKAYGEFIDSTQVDNAGKIDLINTYGIARQGTRNKGYVYYKPAKNVLDYNTSTWNHTSNSDQNWIEVELPVDANLENIKVQIGLTQFAYRLKDASIYLRESRYKTGDELDPNSIVGTLKDSNQEQSFTLNSHRQGRFLLIKAKGHNFLHIATIKAFGMINNSINTLKDIDLTQNKCIARQGTTDTGYIYYKPASNVLDYNTSTWNHTRNSPNENWVEIALNRRSNIEKVKVQIGLTQFAYRLNNATVYLRDTQYHLGDTLDEKDVIGTLQDTPNAQWFNLDTHRQAQYILVKAQGGNFLHINSIEAYGMTLSGEEHFAQVNSIAKIEFTEDTNTLIHRMQMSNPNKTYTYKISGDSTFTIDNEGNIYNNSPLISGKTYILNVTADDGLLETSTQLIIVVGQDLATTTNNMEDYSSEYNITNNMIGNLEGQLWFMQSHMQRPKPKAGEYRPDVIAYRTALLLFMMENPNSVASIQMRVTNNKGEIYEKALKKPSEIALSDQIAPNDGRPLLTFSKRSWTGEIPWNYMTPNMSIELIGYNTEGVQVSSSHLLGRDIVLGQPHEILLNNIDLGMLVEPAGKNKHVNGSETYTSEFAINYFQTAPISKYTVARYAPAYFPKVVMSDGTVYTEKSTDTTAGAHSGDMRGDIGKALVSIGIDLANIGVPSSKSRQDNYDRFIRQTVAHTARGMYTDSNDASKSVVVAHGLSGGAGKLTLYCVHGNEFSHEYGHDFGLPHFPGGVLSIHNYMGGWSYDAYKKRFLGNLDWTQPPAARIYGDESVAPYNNHYQYLTDAMAGGRVGHSAITKFTYYTPYSGYKMQKNLEYAGIIDDSSPTGYSQWNKDLGKYETKTVNYPKPTQTAIPVMTLLGYYDPAKTMETFIYPALYSNYGSYFDPHTLNSIELDSTCRLEVRNSSNYLYSFHLKSTRLDDNVMNQFQVNLPLDEGPYSNAIITCSGTELARRDIEPLDFNLKDPIVVGQENGFAQALSQMRTFSERYEPNQFRSKGEFLKTFNNDFAPVQKYTDSSVVHTGESYYLNDSYYLALSDDASSPNDGSTQWRYLGDASTYIQSGDNDEFTLEIGTTSQNFTEVYDKSMYFYVPAQDNAVKTSDTVAGGGWLRGGKNTIVAIGIDRITGNQQKITLLAHCGGYKIDSGRVISHSSALDFDYDTEANVNIPKGIYDISFETYGTAWHDRNQEIRVHVKGTFRT